MSLPRSASSTPTPASRAAPLRLSRAIRLGEASELAKALAQGANPNATTRGNQSILSLACELNQIESALILVEAGACPDGSKADRANGREPIQLACAHNLPSVVLALARAGAGTRLAFPNELDDDLLSEWIHRPDCVAALIEAGADINAVNYCGETPLMRACIPRHSVSEAEMARSAELLLAAGADPTPLNHSGQSALELAHDLKSLTVAGLIRAALEKKALLSSTPRSAPNPLSSPSNPRL